MDKLQLHIQGLESRETAEICANLMAQSEPWITLKRGYHESLEIILDHKREVYVAWRGKNILGFIIVEMNGTFKGYIKSVYVSPKHRGRGIGTKLVDYAEKRIFSETTNVFLLVSSFNSGARKLYTNLGYEEIGELRDFIIQGESEILMRKTIGPLTE